MTLNVLKKAQKIQWSLPNRYLAHPQRTDLFVFVDVEIVVHVLEFNVRSVVGGLPDNRLIVLKKGVGGRKRPRSPEEV